MKSNVIEMNPQPRFCESLINTGMTPPEYRWYPDLSRQSIRANKAKRIIDHFRKVRYSESVASYAEKYWDHWNELEWKVRALLEKVA